jgi:hypothetical protein
MEIHILFYIRHVTPNVIKGNSRVVTERCLAGIELPDNYLRKIRYLFSFEVSGQPRCRKSLFTVSFIHFLAAYSHKFEAYPIGAFMKCFCSCYFL